MKKITIQAQGAGTAGEYALKIGVGVVGAIGWAVGVYTWLTGRPPP